MEKSAQQIHIRRSRPIGVTASGTRPSAPEPVVAACPLCGARTQIPDSSVDHRLQCSTCGMHFQWTRRGTTTTGSAADPLERWLGGAPIRAKEPTDRQRLVQWCRQRPYLVTALVGLAALVMAIAVVGTTGFFCTSARLRVADRRLTEVQQRYQQAEANAANCARLAADQEQFKLRQQQTYTEVEKRCQQAQQQVAAAAAQLRNMEQQQRDLARQGQLALARELARRSEELLQTHPSSSLYLAAQSLRARSDGDVPSDPAVEQILRDTLSNVGGQVLQGHAQSVQVLDISADGRWMVSGSSDKTARLWDLNLENPSVASRVLGGHRGRISAAAISPNCHWLITADSEGMAFLWDLTTSDPSAKPIALEGHRGRINAVAVSADSHWLVTAGGGLGMNDNSARLWDLGAQNPAAAPMELRGHEKPVLTAAISPDGRWVVTGSEDKTVRLFNLSARYPAAEQIVLSGHEGWVVSLAVSPDSRWLVSGSYDNTARLWDLTAPEPGSRGVVLRGHQGWVSAVAISPDARWVATGSFDKTARLWNVGVADPSSTSSVLAGHTGRVRGVAFSPDGRWLVTGSFDRTVRLWNLTSGDVASAAVVLRGHQGPVSTLAISPDSRWLATASGELYENSDNAIRLWDLRMDSLLDTATRTAARRLDTQQREQLLMEAAQQGQSLR